MSTSPPPHDRDEARRNSPRFVTGRLLAGRYEILERIGEGGTAEVFRARDHRLDRVVAVKVLRPQFGQDPDARARFAVEARSAAALAVPNIVPVFDFGAADDGSLFIVMRFIDGPSLRQVLSERGSLPAATAVDVGIQVAHALAAAHAHGLIHRDVKPGNILLDADGTAHLTDFGTVKALAGATDLTHTGMIFGTAAYISPEQATGGAIGPRTDLYALGAVLYEALASRPPFSGDDPTAIAYRHAHESPTPLGVALPGTEPGLQRLVMQCLEKDPERRPASARDVAAALQSIAGGLASASPDLETVAGLAAAAPRAAPAGPTFARQPEGLDKETVLMSTVPPTAPLERGTVPHGRIVAAGERRRGGAAGFAVLVLLAMALLTVGTVWALTLIPRGDNGGVIGQASPTVRPVRSRAASVPPVALVTPTPTPTAPPESTLEVTPPPPPQPVPTPEPTPIREPEPTVAPQVPDAVSVEIPDNLFVGGYDGRTRYHGRTASWVYGQATPYHTMTAEFRLAQATAAGPASLELIGLDGENPIKNMMRIVLNGVTIYEGPNPLPDDDCCGSSGPGNWGSAVFEFGGELLRRNNSLSITNLEPNDCTTCPKYVMVDYGVLRYRALP